VFTWNAPEECPSADTIRAQVNALLGGASVPASRPLAVHATARRVSEDRWRLELRIDADKGGGRRALEARSCRELADALALIVAMSIDPERVRGEAPATAAASAAPTTAASPTTAPPSDAPATTPPASAPPASAPPASAKERPPPPAENESTPNEPQEPGPWSVFLGASGDAGALPGLAYGVLAGVGWRAARWRAEASGAFWPTEREALASAPQSGGRFWLAAGTLRGCYALVASAVDLGPCAGLELGAFTGTGYGLAFTQSKTAPWGAGLVGGSLLWHPGERWGLRLELDALVPFFRPTFTADGPGPVYQASVMTGRVIAAVEFRL
jgi:hypothetical protein